MFRTLVTLGALGFATTAMAENTPISGNVASKCSIFTDTPGVYGNPTPDELSTKAADGGINPVIRYDVTIADYYTAKISYPNGFTSSPTLNDALAWDGEVTVSATSDTGMSGYEASKIEYENVTEYALSIAGSTWFEVESSVAYGSDKAFPGGEYKSAVVAECIAD